MQKKNLNYSLPVDNILYFVLWQFLLSKYLFYFLITTKNTLPDPVTTLKSFPDSLHPSKWYFNPSFHIIIPHSVTIIRQCHLYSTHLDWNLLSGRHQKARSSSPLNNFFSSSLLIGLLAITGPHSILPTFRILFCTLTQTWQQQWWWFG